jgi:hypothetical protein
MSEEGFYLLLLVQFGILLYIEKFPSQMDVRIFAGAIRALPTYKLTVYPGTAQ